MHTDATAPTPDHTAMIRDLMLSPTMSLIGALAKGSPLDPTNPDDRRAGLATTSLALVRALDAERIHFDQSDDRALCHGLLAMVFEVMFDGQFGRNIQTATLQ